MKLIISTALGIVFALVFFTNSNITLAQCGSGPSCTGNFVCVNADGTPKCLLNQVSNNGLCEGDSSVKCSANQACIQNQEKEIVCAPLSGSSANTNLPPAGGSGGNGAGGNGGSGSGSSGLSDGLTQFQNAGSGLNTGGTLIGYIANIIRWILGILGTVFFVIIVLQGYLYMVSSGDSSQTAAATGAITNAVIGLLIIMGAFLITNFVTSGLISSGGGDSTSNTTTNSQFNDNNNTNIQPKTGSSTKCGTATCGSGQVCVNVDGATKCLQNQVTSSGICPGDSSIRCGSGQACIQNNEREIVCARISTDGR